MSQKRYKTIEVTVGVECNCGECDNEPIFIVLDENLSIETMAGEDDVLCECYSQESADLIVNALNRLATN